MAVVADVHADLADGRLEHRVSLGAGREVELLPEPLHLRDVLLAVLAEVRTVRVDDGGGVVIQPRSEEHTSELQSLMRISYAVFCLQKKKRTYNNTMTII